MASQASACGTNLILKDLFVDGQWKTYLTSEFIEPYFQDLEWKLAKEYRTGKVIYPPKELIFNAMNLTPLEEVKVVIVGQDPYPGYGKAMGLAFSVRHGKPVPRSLQNIYAELVRDPSIMFNMPNHGNLEAWAKQGVLLLNSRLTVGAGVALSRAHIGWNTFTDRIIEVVNQQYDHVVFMLWGALAHKKEKLINGSKHTVIKTDHPSPQSCLRGVNNLIGSNCFSNCNIALMNYGISPICWSIY